MSAELSKTKEALVAELEAAHREIAELKRVDVELRQAESALVESEERYRSMIQHMTDGVSVYEPVDGGADFLFKDINEAGARIGQMKRSEHIGRSLMDLYPEMEKFGLLDAFRKVNETGEPMCHPASAYQDDKIAVWVENHIYKLPSGEIVAVYDDITERKRAEEALRESEAFIRAVMDNLPIGIAVNSVNPEVNFEYMSENFPKHYHTTREALEKRDAFFDAVFEDPEYRKEIRQRVLDDCASGDPERMHWEDVVITRKGQKTHFITARNTPVPDRGLMISTVFDVTDRKWAEKEKELLNQELMSKNQELEQIVYVSSHDLRSPLVNIQGFSKELESCFQDVASALESGDALPDLRQQLAPLINEDIPEALGFIAASVNKMDGLLAGLLKLSRLGRLAFVPKKLDMNKLLANVVAAHEFQLKESKVVFTLEELPPCYGDETQINQVFSNLLGNALKYLEPERSGVITVSGWKDKKNSVYCVEDNGIGVPEGQHGGIFEIFRRLNPKENPGEGLGLTIVRRITDRHQGETWLESELGTGSKFYVSLPRMSKA